MGSKDRQLTLMDRPRPLKKPQRGAPVIDRIRWNVVLHSSKLDTPCWFWTGYCANGYGQISVSTNRKRKMIYVHRWLYQHYVGPIPPGEVLHHQCETPHCVNPTHLESMTQQSNIRQFTTKKTHCKHGHPLRGQNLYITSQGTRGCRACNRKTQRDLGARARKTNDREAFKYKRLPRGTPVLDRILAKTVKRKGPLESTCWIWMGSLAGPGYGQIRVTENGKSRKVMVHRWMFEHHSGTPPGENEVHHRCDTPRCVNPDHLETLSHRDNLLETTKRMTHCKHGHPLSGKNVRVTADGHRLCRACLYRRVQKQVKQRDAVRKSSLRTLRSQEP